MGVQPFKGDCGETPKAVSIPILRVGVQQAISNFMVSINIVSIPILRVGVQPNHLLTLLHWHEFQFPYCAWEFNPKKLLKT